MMKKSLTVDFFCFSTIIDGYKITIEAYWADKYSSQEQLIDDPNNTFVKAFLTDEEMADAIGVLKTCINNQKNK